MTRVKPDDAYTVARSSKTVDMVILLVLLVNISCLWVPEGLQKEKTVEIIHRRTTMITASAMQAGSPQAVGVGCVPEVPCKELCDTSTG